YYEPIRLLDILRSLLRSPLVGSYQHPGDAEISQVPRLILGSVLPASIPAGTTHPCHIGLLRCCLRTISTASAPATNLFRDSTRSLALRPATSLSTLHAI